MTPSKTDGAARLTRPPTKTQAPTATAYTPERRGNKPAASASAADIAWSGQQRAALDAIKEWRARGGGAPFYLAGYAGTGKTTLAREIGLRAANAVYATFTGKAASVMRRKGCANASTIDALIYIPELETFCAAEPPCANPKGCPNTPADQPCPCLRERFIGRTLNKQSEVTSADLIIIDEVSMVGEQMGVDLLSFGTPVLVLGDPGQLPPIQSAGFFTNRTPDFFLSGVHRQALGSPVIQLATLAREGRALPKGQHGDSAVISRRDDISINDILGHDQIIVGTHRTRHSVNRQIRHALGYGGATPEVGEKVLCLKNSRPKGVHNGTLWKVVKAAPPRRGFVELEIEDDDHRRVDVEAPVEGFSLQNGNGAELPGQPFTYGYAITAHKSQGSQWDAVLVIDESLVFRQDRFRWLYTALTRASKRVTVVTP